MTMLQLRSFIALHMDITRYLLGHGLLCAVGVCELHLKKKKHWHYCCITAVWVGSAMSGDDTVCLMLWLLCQPGERLCCVRLCYDCCPEMRNVSAVPMAPGVFFQPISLHFVYHGFDDQCPQWDTVRQLASGTGWRATHIHIYIYSYKNVQFKI